MMRHSNNTFVLSNSVSGSSEPQEELDIYQNNVESGVEDWPNCQPDEVIKIMKILERIIHIMVEIKFLFS
mgnify:CR=1 FL=1